MLPAVDEVEIAGFEYLTSGGRSRTTGATRQSYDEGGLDNLIEAERIVAEVAHDDPETSEQSLDTSPREDRIDRGPVDGLTSSEKAELTTVKKRIADLEA